MRYCLITEGVVKQSEEARYFSRGQKHLFTQEAEEEDRALCGPDVTGATIEELDNGEEEGLRATG